MAVLITGLGYLGVPLAAELLRRGMRVVGLDNFFSTSPRHLRAVAAFPNFTLIRGSVTSNRTLERACSVEAIQLVYHLAAQPSAHPQAATPGYTERTNLVGPRKLLDALATATGCTVVLASSFRVYGDDLPPIVTESTPYGRMADLSHLSKIYAEKLLELYAHRTGLKAIALRLGVVHGLGPCMKHDRRFMSVPNLFCHQAVRGEPLQVHRGAAYPMGFIEVSDAVTALVDAPRLAQPGFRAVNAVTEMLSVPEVAELVRERGASRGLRVQVSNGRSAPASAIPTVASSLDEIGYRPTRLMASSLDEVLDYFERLERRPSRTLAATAST